MTKKKAPKAPPSLNDDAQRTAVIKERNRDVIVLAGAGSGKTSLLTKRFVELLAPQDDSLPAAPVERLAAVTFTRKAAGELKNRIRIELLALFETRLSEVRRQRVVQAISDLDFSSIGTIHSFADRLLRLRPIEARVSPSYEIVEDTDALVQEAAYRWIEGVRTGKLEEQWSNPENAPAKPDCEAAVKWGRDLFEADVKIHDVKFENSSQIGIEGLVRDWVNQRDRDTPIKVSAPYSRTGTDKALKDIQSAIKKCTESLSEASLDPGAKHLASLMDNLSYAIEADSLGKKVKWLVWVFRDAKFEGRSMTRKDHFSKSADQGTWDLYNQLRGSGKNGGLNESVFRPLVEALLAPAAKIQHVVLSLYEDVKKRHETVDQLDLLIRLRDLLANNKVVQKSFGNLFDHVFVDEFQDTDPIQAEILLHLCERPGMLTIIGDPKQSIYRFRRADISIFAKAVNHLLDRGALLAHLKTNFRSRPALIHAFNRVFPDYFGPSPDTNASTSKEFHAESGWVAYSPLDPDPEAQDLKDPSLCFLRVDAAGAEIVGEQRPLEARLAARHIAWMLSKKSTLRIPKRQSSDKGRPVVGSDIAVLTRSMTNINLLVRELRELGVEVHITGGDEYASSPTIHRYILALCAVANPNDGQGALTWHQFPFSSVTPLDTAAQAPDDIKLAEGSLRSWLKELRRERLNRPILHTALEVIEESLALRILGVGVNADEDLAMLYRFANIFADAAAKNGWDFDETARWARGWIDTPPKINSPATENKNAVRIMTIHQAKGLEFPVVYLYDGFGREGSDRNSGYRASSDGQEWTLSIGGLDATFNPKGRNPDFKAREANHVREEQKRLHYVAATRAMDFLVIPIPEPTPSASLYNKVWGAYLADNKSAKEGRHLAYRPTKAEGTANHLVPYDPQVEWLRPKVEDIPIPISLAREIAEHAGPVTHFTSVTSEAHRAPNDNVFVAASDDDPASTPAKVFLPSGGAALGTAVHRALQLYLAAQMPLEKAVRVAIHELGQPVDNTLATAHVKNAVQILESQGFLDGSWTVHSEVPFVHTYQRDGQPILVRGIIDLLLVKKNSAHIIDFKTDGSALDPKTQAQYQEQLAAYESAVRQLVPALTQLTTSLLMTAQQTKK